MKTLELFSHDSVEPIEVCELTRVPEILKLHGDSCFRSAFFSEEGKNGCFGPLNLTFAVRTAKDILLEGCDYQGLEIKLETAGRILPAMPVQAELVKLLEAPDTLIHINGNVFKPNTEVFGFQQVYDDSVKIIDFLKKLGFSNDTMAIYATPNDISLEVNGSAVGLEGNNELSSRYYSLICHLANIREVGGKPQKTDIRTVLLDTALLSSRVLIPGSLHPTMKRTKVGVGASHFAYGIAAFSDTCGKKRSLQESIQESLNWVHFNEKKLAPVSGIRELLDTLPKIVFPDKNRTAAAVTSFVNSATILASLAPAVAKGFVGVFQPLKAEIEAASGSFKVIPAGIPAFSQLLDKALGSGWSTGGVHIVVGNMENGKATLLLQQAMLSENKMPVLFVSFEQNLKGFVTNAASLIGGINRTELLAGMANAVPNSNQIKLAFGAAVDRLQTKLSQNLHFSGVETGRIKFDADEIIQLASMLPEASNRLVIIDSVSEDDFGNETKAQLQKLKAVALAGNMTVIISVHTKAALPKRPNFIEEEDFSLLDRYQRFTDTIIDLSTDRTNMRKFVAMVKGQVDPALVANLEQKALQLCGGKRLKSDSYSILRLIHNRSGRRDMLLMVYQPDMGRFFDLATVPLSRA